MKPTTLVFCLLLLCTGSCTPSEPATETQPPSSVTQPATLVCDQDTAAALLAVSTESLRVGDTISVTVTVKNEGCVALGLPQYRLSIQPDGSQPIFTPKAPDPVVHYLSVNPGESDAQTFELAAVASGQVTLIGLISYEVHLGYPGPAYWGSASTQPLTLAVSP